MTKKIILSFLLGLIITIFLAQYDPWTHQKIIQMCQKVARELFACNVTCHVESVNFFLPSIIFTDITVESHEKGAWSWQCKRCEITCSWLQLLLTGAMERHMVMDEFHCFSLVHGTHAAIEPYINALLEESFLPIAVNFKSHLVKNSFLQLNDPHSKYSFSTFFNASSLKVGNVIKTTFSLFDGVITYDNHDYMSHITGSVSSIIPDDKTIYDSSFMISTTGQILTMDKDDVCCATLSWNGGRARGMIRNTHNTLHIDPIIITEKDIRLDAHMPLSLFLFFTKNNYIHNTIKGNVHCIARITFDDDITIDGQAVVHDIYYENHDICMTGKINFSRKNQQWKSKISLNHNNQECVGYGYWDERFARGKLTLHNNTIISLPHIPYWRSVRNNSTCNILFDHDEIVALCQIHAEQMIHNTSHFFTGTMHYKKEDVKLQGFINDQEFEINAKVEPHILLRHCLYKNKDKQPLFFIRAKDNQPSFFDSYASFSCLRYLLSLYSSYDVQGQGLLLMNIQKKDDEIIIDVALDNPIIRLSHLYNFINDTHMRLRYALNTHELCIEDMILSLHKGKISCKRAVFYFNKNGSLRFFHAPIIFDECFLIIKKDLFACISGNIITEKHENKAMKVQGNIIIDRGQLKENLFSAVIQKQLFSYTHSAFSLSDISVVGELSFETKSPIRVDTAFLKTNAHARIKVFKDKEDPQISGEIILQNGSLIFPYKPLSIQRGSLIFTPGQLFNPTIELIARNKIKKYDITLQVVGSLLSHHIMLDSSPPLSEEQIVALLLVGSEESLLNSMMPALIMQNIKKLIFSNNQSLFLEKYFKPLLRPFSITLVPSFSDQTGRGGLRGAVEISVEDRWRAVIQKNFSLTEDTRVELEFLLSDDITIKAIRDERRDIGGEIEMRWKF